MAKLLEVKNLKTQFFTQDGVVHAVNGITYEVDQGETVAIVAIPEMLLRNARPEFFAKFDLSSSCSSFGFRRDHSYRAPAKPLRHWLSYHDPGGARGHCADPPRPSR